MKPLPLMLGLVPVFAFVYQLRYFGVVPGNVLELWLGLVHVRYRFYFGELPYLKAFGNLGVEIAVQFFLLLDFLTEKLNQPAFHFSHSFGVPVLA